jgi:hypothetical protein
MKNPYDKGGAANKILYEIKNIGRIHQLAKRFYDIAP